LRAGSIGRGLSQNRARVRRIDAHHRSCMRHIEARRSHVHAYIDLRLAYWPGNIDRAAKPLDVRIVIEGRDLCEPACSIQSPPGATTRLPRPPPTSQCDERATPAARSTRRATRARAAASSSHRSPPASRVRTAGARRPGSRRIASPSRRDADGDGGVYCLAAVGEHPGVGLALGLSLPAVLDQPTVA
jgi:hypothetical protein